jgi:hypothetical protein
MGARLNWRSIAALGSELGLGSLGELATRVSGTVRRITSPCVYATAVIGAEAAEARAITVTFKDRKGDAINYAACVELMTFTTSAMVDFAAKGGSTGIAQGATGKLLAIVAKKIYRGITSTGGVIACTYTDTGTEAVHLGARLPNGELVYLGNLTNA